MLSETPETPSTRLSQLEDLHRSGVLSDEEYRAAVERLSGQPVSSADRDAAAEDDVPVGDPPPPATHKGRWRAAVVGIGGLVILGVVGLTVALPHGEDRAATAPQEEVRSQIEVCDDLASLWNAQADGASEAGQQALDDVRVLAANQQSQFETTVVQEAELIRDSVQDVPGVGIVYSSSYELMAACGYGIDDPFAQNPHFLPFPEAPPADVWSYVQQADLELELAIQIGFALGTRRADPVDGVECDWPISEAFTVQAVEGLSFGCSFDSNDSAKGTGTVTVTITDPQEPTSFSWEFTDEAVTGDPLESTPLTPEEVAMDLFDAWRDGDRDAAGLVASPEVVAQLFREPSKGYAFGDGGCHRRDGSDVCEYGRLSDAMRIGLKVTSNNQGVYTITEILYMELCCPAE